MRQASRLKNPVERQIILDAAMGTGNGMHVGRLNGWKVSSKSFAWMEERVHEGTSVAGPPVLGRILETHLRHSAHFSVLGKLSQEPQAFGQANNGRFNNNNRRRNNNNRRRNNNNNNNNDGYQTINVEQDSDSQVQQQQGNSTSNRRNDRASWEEPSRRRSRGN